jgi:hypothetical protein
MGRKYQPFPMRRRRGLPRGVNVMASPRNQTLRRK